MNIQANSPRFSGLYINLSTSSDKVRDGLVLAGKKDEMLPDGVQADEIKLNGHHLGRSGVLEFSARALDKSMTVTKEQFKQILRKAVDSVDTSTASAVKDKRTENQSLKEFFEDNKARILNMIDSGDYTLTYDGSTGSDILFVNDWPIPFF